MSNANNGTGSGSFIPNSVWIIPPAAPTQQTFTISLGGGGAAPILTGDLSGSTTPVAEIKKVNKDGCVCKKCKELFPYAEPNQKDGTLICYACRVRW